MENLSIVSHQFILDSKVGDYYMVGDNKISIIRKTKGMVHFSNGEIVGIRKLGFGRFYLHGKNINQILKDIEDHSSLANNLW
jgi:hypothetical protein